MPDCELIKDCMFFNGRMASMPALADMYRLTYCHEDNRECARFQVCRGLGREAVPDDLAPHMLEEARSILAARKPPEA